MPSKDSLRRASVRGDRAMPSIAASPRGSALPKKQALRPARSMVERSARSFGERVSAGSESPPVRVPHVLDEGSRPASLPVALRLLGHVPVLVGEVRRVVPEIHEAEDASSERGASPRVSGAAPLIAGGARVGVVAAAEVAVALAPDRITDALARIAREIGRGQEEGLAVLHEGPVAEARADREHLRVVEERAREEDRPLASGADAAADHAPLASSLKDAVVVDADLRETDREVSLEAGIDVEEEQERCLVERRADVAPVVGHVRIRVQVAALPRMDQVEPHSLETSEHAAEARHASDG